MPRAMAMGMAEGYGLGVWYVLGLRCRAMVECYEYGGGLWRRAMVMVYGYGYGYGIELWLCWRVMAMA